MNIEHHIKNHVISVTDFVTPEWCENRIAQSESMGFETAKLTTIDGQVEDLSIRNNRRLFFKDKVLAQDLFDKIAPSLPSPFRGREAVRLNEMFRIYRYDIGQQFDWHLDGYYQSPDHLRSRFTLMIYLNADFTGGGTTFSDRDDNPEFSDFTITPEIGKALLFYHPILHRGDPVQSGRKYVLRTDVMYGW